GDPLALLASQSFAHCRAGREGSAGPEGVGRTQTEQHEPAGCETLQTENGSQVTDAARDVFRDEEWLEPVTPGRPTKRLRCGGLSFEAPDGQPVGADAGDRFDRRLNIHDRVVSRAVSVRTRGTIISSGTRLRQAALSPRGHLAKIPALISETGPNR